MVYNPPTPPEKPHFELITSIDTWREKYSTLLSQIVALAHGGNAEQAMMKIIYQLMPYVQNYNMDYTQAENANSQEAASYAIGVTNYISSCYQQVGQNSQKGGDPSQDPYLAADAQAQWNDFNKFLNETSSSASSHHIADPFGSMGSNVLNQLSSAMCGETGDSGTLASDWEKSWDMSNYNSGGVSGTGSNSIIMQDINGAQNQAQSQAAYVQSAMKIANENYQQFSATQHDVEQNIIGVEKATTTASQSAGN